MKNTLEDVLQLMGSKKPFLKTMKIENDMRQPFTKTGSKAYNLLTDVLYKVGELTNTDMNDIIETLDNIADEYY